MKWFLRDYVVPCVRASYAKSCRFRDVILSNDSTTLSFPLLVLSNRTYSRSALIRLQRGALPGLNTKDPTFDPTILSFLLQHSTLRELDVRSRIYIRLCTLSVAES